MSSSMVHGVESAVTAVWRAHAVLDESDGADSSPEAPDRFRKLRSSTSLNSLRMSLRKRLPLRSIQSNVEDTPTWETLDTNRKPSAVSLLTRSARNSIGTAYQKLQKIRAPREECLVATPGKTPECEDSSWPRRSQAAHTPCKPAAAALATVTPKRGPQRTPRSATKRTPRASRTPKSGGPCQGVRPGNSRRQLVRMAALRSPFASPNTMSNRRKFDRDLESVSSGLRKLKRLSQAFDDVIGRDDRVQAAERCRGVNVSSNGPTQRDPPSKITRASIRCRTQRMRETMGSWTSVALSSIHKTT
ncbi:protein PIMREG-like isoform X2 [Anguilla rostrata]